MIIDCNKDPIGHCIEAFKSKDADHRYNAADILRGLAGEAEPALVVLCQHLENDPDNEVRRQCVFALVDIGYALKDKAKSVLPYLQIALSDKDEEIAELAAEAINAINT